MSLFFHILNIVCGTIEDSAPVEDPSFASTAAILESKARAR